MTWQAVPHIDTVKKMLPDISVKKFQVGNTNMEHYIIRHKTVTGNIRFEQNSQDLNKKGCKL